MYINNLGHMTKMAAMPILAREPAVGLIKWLRPKGLMTCSEAEKCAELRNLCLTKICWYTILLYANEYSHVTRVCKLS